MCSRKCDIPVVPGTSLRPPTWYQTQSETTGACRASSACITSPLSRRREAGASVTAGMRKVYEAGGPPGYWLEYWYVCAKTSYSHGTDGVGLLSCIWMFMESPAASDSHGLPVVASSGRHCIRVNTGCSSETVRTTTTRWSFEKAGTVVPVSIAKSHPTVPTVGSPAHAFFTTWTPSTSPIVVRLRATLNSWTSLLLNAVANRTTVHESPGGIGKYQF